MDVDSKLKAADGTEDSPSESDLDPRIQKLLHSDKMTAEHVKHVLITGAGFFADSYDLFVVNLVLVLMKDCYGQTSSDKSMVASTAIWGAVVGQLFFGLLADVIGRRVVCCRAAAKV